MDWNEINTRWVKPARAAWMSGDTERAEEIFLEGLSETGGDGFVALVYAGMLEELGRVEKAVEQFRFAQSRLPLPKYKAQAAEGLARLGTLTGKAGVGGKTWGLITCTKHKQDYPCTARELYSASPRFREHLQFAEENYDHVWVISARHGLVALNQLLAPYDRALNAFEAAERDAWARFIVANLKAEGLGSSDDIFIHADVLYAKHLADALHDHVNRIEVVDFEGRPDGGSFSRVGLDTDDIPF